MFGRRTCGTQRLFLRVTKQVGYVSENITRIELENGISAGISLGYLDADMVPMYEEHAIRLEKNYKLSEWYELDSMERAMIIAVYRIDNARKNLQAEAEIRAAKKSQKQRK